MEYITILGSCRQDSISNYYNVSYIKEKLSFCHYSSEILQAIKYLKYRNIKTEFTKYCFGSGILSKCTKEITDENYNFFKNEFDKTTFFLIEIATIKKFKWNNLSLHRICIGEQFNFYDRDNIIVEDQTDEEIENDIIQIKNELYPKPFVIISHFATYEKGKRYELTQLLKYICLKHNIPFLNQSDIIKEFGLDILNKEEVLSHYTSQGHNIVGQILFNKINDVKNNVNK